MNKKRLKILATVLIALISLLIGEISRRSFINYEKRIISQQQEQLLTISRLVGRNILNFVEEKVKGVNYLAENIKSDLLFKERELLLLKRLEAFSESHGNQISSLHYIDFTNETMLNYPVDAVNRVIFKTKEEFMEELDKTKELEKAFIGEVYKIEEKAYAFNIYKTVLKKGDIVGAIVVKINVNDVYDLLVKPVKAGQFGYAMLKNSDGIIIMHPAKEQIGYDVLVDRKQKYPKLDYSELEILVKKQLTGAEGTHIYHSYWWPQEKLEKVKKFQAFSPIYITKKFWIVAVTMSYEEVRGAIKKYLYNITAFALTLISVISMALFMIIRMASNKEAHRIEMNYLKEINESSENLRKKDAELHQKRKVETIGTLTGGIAHEFNNILTPIMGYSEMILSDLKVGDENYDEMTIINDSSKRARDVIDQILLFSRDKNVILQYEVLEMRKVVENALKFFEAITPSNIKIIKKISSNSGNVFANEMQLHQVVLNLCINAYKFMKESGGKLEIEVRELDIEEVTHENSTKLINDKLENKKYIKLSVSDTGVGIESEKLEKMFKSINSTEYSESSIELGLPAIIGIILKHGGKIYVESELGEGSRFNIYLPQSDRKLESDKFDLESYQGDERVLVVDDEEAIADMLRKRLEELGYKVTSYSDGAEVLRDFNLLKDKIDIIVSDVRMPEISGIQLAKKFRRNKPSTKIILMTANTEEPLEEYIQNKIIDDYILKPVSSEGITKRIRRVMDKK